MNAIAILWKKIKSLFDTVPRTKPEKIWCFYRDPYQKGFAVTGLAFGGAILLTILVFVIIGLIALGLFIISGVLYIGSVVGAIWVVILAYGSMESNEKGALVGTVILGAIMFAVVKFIFGVADGIWEFSVGFSENLNYAGVAWSWLVANALNIFLFIIFPSVAVLTFAGATIGLNYSARYFESFFSRINGIRYPCPECTQKTEPALYSCPKCTFRHGVNLLPNEYGIFSHTCEHCSASLPTMMLLGRNKLPHLCPHCETDLHPDALGTDRHIAFVGGVGSGKTCLLLQATRHLLDRNGKIPEPEQEREFEAVWEMMQRGEAPRKTQVKNIYRAFQVLYKKKPVPWNLHFYDIAGERYEHTHDATMHRFYAALDAVVFLFEPFSIEEFRNAHTLPPGFQHATQDPLELIRNLTQVLEKYRMKDGVKKIALNVLMVKTDTGYLQDYVQPGMDQQQLNSAIRQFLLNELEQSAFIHHIEHSFTKINFLYASALGRTPESGDHSPFVPDNIEETFRKIYLSARVRV